MGNALEASQTIETTGSQLLLELLIEQGVDTLFGYPGGAIMPVYDALYDYRDRLRHILVRHEQGATHAAEGYARVTGKCGVCLATSGPGATNLVTGIADAMLDSIPLVCITGQVSKAFLGTDAFQETDIIGITIPITKWSYQVTSAEELRKVIPMAFAVARSGRPGPVLIDITKNAQFERISWDPQERSLAPTLTCRQLVDLSGLRSAATLINSANKPLILAGHGVLIAGAQHELVQLAEKTDTPVASTLLGLSAIPTSHPLYVGMLGMHGNYAPNILTNCADVIIAIGMRFDDRVTGKLSEYARHAKIIHIDIDPAELNKNVAIDVGLVADAREALANLLPLVEKRSHDLWRHEFSECLMKECEAVIDSDLAPREGKPRMSRVVHELSNVSRGDAIVVADVGQHQMATARYYRFVHPNSFITSGGLGTMGFGVPAGMGAAVAAPDRNVLVVVGDGGFQMTVQELGTIRQQNLAVKIVILNNNFLGMVRQWQQLFFEKRYSFVEMDNPNFQKIAEAYDIPSQRVDNSAALHDAIVQMWRTPGPYLLEVCVEREDNIFPMIPAGAGIQEIRLR